MSQLMKRLFGINSKKAKQHTEIVKRKAEEASYFKMAEHFQKKRRIENFFKTCEKAVTLKQYDELATVLNNTNLYTEEFEGLIFFLASEKEANVEDKVVKVKLLDAYLDRTVLSAADFQLLIDALVKDNYHLPVTKSLQQTFNNHISEQQIQIILKMDIKEYPKLEELLLTFGYQYFS